MAIFLIFSNKYSIVTPPSRLSWKNLLMQICCQLRILCFKTNLRFLDSIKWPQNPKWRQKPVFSYFCSHIYNFDPISKIFFAFEASFYYLTFIEKTFFQKSKMADFFKMAWFFRKNRLFFTRAFPTLNLSFSKFLKRHFVVQKPNIYQKNLPRKISQNGGDIQDGVWVLFHTKL